MGKESMQNRKPMILVLAGPNGSGKSTITTFLIKLVNNTNAYDVVATTGMNNMEAAVLVAMMRYESIAKKEDFTFETVLSSEYKLNILRKAKEGRIQEEIQNNVCSKYKEWFLCGQTMKNKYWLKIIQ